MFDVEKFIALVEERPALYDPRVQEYSSREIKSRCWWEIGSHVCDNWDELDEREKYEKEKELMRKWKAIRDNFVKDIRHRKKLLSGEGVPKRRRYIYYAAMQFLLPIIDDGEDSEQLTNGDKVVLEENHLRSKTRQMTKNKHFTDTSSMMLNDNYLKKEETDIFMELANSSSTDIASITTSLPPISKISSNTSALKKQLNILSQTSSKPNEKRKDIFGNRAFLLSYAPIMDDLPPNLVLEARLKITEVFRNICATNVTPRSALSEPDIILPETLVELVDSPSDISLDLDSSN